MAWLKTVEAPCGSAVSRPWTRCCTMDELMCSRLVRPSRAMRAGNSDRNQW